MIKSVLSCLFRFINKENNTKMTKVEEPVYDESQYDDTIPPVNNTYVPGLNCSTMLTVPEHRSGWNYVSEYCKKLHNPNGYLLVDFVEKMWCWNKLKMNDTKGVFYNDVAYTVDFDNIKMIHGMEYAILNETDRLCVYWNGSEWVESKLSFERVKNADIYGIFTTPWVGIVHNPPNVPLWFDHENSPQQLIQNEQFQLSLTNCKGLIVLSEYLKSELLKLGGWPCAIDVVYHPTEPSEFRWKGVAHHQRKLVQIGYWLRKLTSIWDVHVPDNWSKYWINRADYGFTCLEKEIYNEHKLMSIIQTPSKVNVLKLSNDEYDTFLQDSVIFLDLYDSSCNNAIIEAIVRHIPIIVNRLPATEEYLGADYCLFFDDVSQVYDMLSSSKSEELIKMAYHQLIALEESGKYYGDFFFNQVMSIPFLNEPKPIQTNTVISLGVDCLPRAMATKFDFKNTKANGELSCPFDLAWHDYETTCCLIENDFDKYLDTTRLFINSNGHIAHRDYTIIFNHESENAENLLKFVRNDYELFCERYHNRIQNWNTLLNTDEHVVFLLHYKRYPVELVSIIKRKYPNLEFTILTINCPYVHEKYSDQPSNIERVTDHILFYTIRKPKEDYLWYVDQDEEWESRIEEVLKRHLCKINVNEKEKTNQIANQDILEGCELLII